MNGLLFIVKYQLTTLHTIIYTIIIHIIFHCFVARYFVVIAINVITAMSDTLSVGVSL